MNNNISKKEQNALTRFSVIAPLVDGTFSDAYESFYKQRSTVEFDVNGQKRKFSAATLKRWHLAFKSGGFDALKPKRRVDYNERRKMSETVRTRIDELLISYPNIKVTHLFEMLREEKIVMFGEISESSIRRYVNTKRDTNVDNVKASRRAFDASNTNDLWQADTSITCYIKHNGKNKKVYLMLILDDASRVVVGFDFYFADNAVNFQNTLKDAVSRYGRPRRLYCDNGAPYKNEQLRLICATLGTSLINSKPYSPQSKGKVERVFRTIKEQWLMYLTDEDKSSLDSLRNSLEIYLTSKYHNKIHTSLDMTPIERFTVDSNSISIPHEKLLEEAFYHTVERKVRNDACISIDNNMYEVDGKYIGKRVVIKYNPNDWNIAFVYDNEEYIKISIVDKVTNAKIKRGVEY